jgi:MFS family permease
VEADSTVPVHQARVRNHAFWVLSLGVAMVELDSTIVNVVLPSIKSDLHFSKSTLVWVVDAYLVAFAASLPLAGRLSDLFGHRRIFLYAIALFSLASMECGIARTQAALIGARALQGIGGAAALAAAISLVFSLFTEAPERARVLSFLGFWRAAVRSFSLLLGGSIAAVFGWRWVFRSMSRSGCLGI